MCSCRVEFLRWWSCSSLLEETHRTLFIPRSDIAIYPWAICPHNSFPTEGLSHLCLLSLPTIGSYSTSRSPPMGALRCPDTLPSLGSYLYLCLILYSRNCQVYNLEFFYLLRFGKIAAFHAQRNIYWDVYRRVKDLS